VELVKLLLVVSCCLIVEINKERDSKKLENFLHFLFWSLIQHQTMGNFDYEVERQDRRPQDRPRTDY
jgi:hypothetical protein